MTTEKMIKEAFARQADRAPDHARVLTSVMAKTGERRSRPILYSLIAAGVAAAVAVPIMTLGGGSPETLPGVQKTLAGDDGVMRFEPGYLPDDLIELKRTAYPAGRISRAWAHPRQFLQPKPVVVLEQASYGAGLTAGQGTEKVDINGSEGILQSSGPSPELSWSPVRGVKLSLYVPGIPGGKDELLRIARSVKRGADVPIRPVIEFGWLPPGLNIVSSTVEDMGNSWTVVNVTNRPDKTENVVVQAQISPGAPSPSSGTPITIRGAQGYFLASDTGNWVGLRHGADHWLLVSGPYSQADLVHVADTLKISDDLSFPWLGQR